MKKILMLLLSVLVFGVPAVDAQPKWSVIHQANLEGYDMFDLHAVGDNLIAVGYKADGEASVFRSVILTSADKGKTWTESYRDGRFLKTIDFAADGTGYIGGFGVGSTSYILSSTDNGLTWADHFTDFSNAGITHLEFVDENTGYASGYGSMQFMTPVFYTTADGGQTWSVETENAPAYTTFDKFSFIGPDMYAISSVYFSGSVLGKQICYSPDNGKNWTLIHENAENLGGMAWLDAWTGFIVTESGSIQKSTDGGTTWDEVYNNGDGLFAITLDGEVMYATGANGTILKSENSGETWKKQASGVNKSLSGMVVVDGEAYVLGADGLVLWFGEVDEDDLPPTQWPVGIEDATIETAGVFPNPVEGDQLHITTGKNTVAQDMHFVVFNSLGGLMISEQLNTPLQNLDISSLPAGVYHYGIYSTSGKELCTGKLVRH